MMQQIMAKGRGKTFWRSVVAARRKVKDGEEYLIRRHNAWFRPNAQGYTCEYHDAGVFDAATARGYLDVEGLSVVPLKTVRRSIQAALNELEKQAAALRATLEKM